MEDTNKTTFSKEEVAIINAAFRLLEIVILHRAYRRGCGPKQFTKGALLAAERTLARLRPPAPGVDPVLIVAHFARDHAIAQAAVMSAIEEATKAKQELWDNIRSIELSDAELKTISDGSPIFKMYRGVTTLDKTIKELSHPEIASRLAELVWKLANRLRQAKNRAALANTVREAA